MVGDLENALRLESEKSEGYGTGTHSFSSSNQSRVILELRSEHAIVMDLEIDTLSATPGPEFVHR